jgi:iron complex transport system permease protein
MDAAKALAAHSVPGTQKRWQTVLVILLVAMLLIICAGCFALTGGTPALSVTEVTAILQGSGERVPRIIVTDVRLPRFILSMLSGAALAVSGVILQDTLRNRLAGAEILGVSAGASVMIALVVVFGLPVPWSAYPWLALAGGLVVGGLLLSMMRRIDDPVRLILIGAAFTAFCNSCIIAIVSMGTQSQITVLYMYLVGSLSSRTWQHVNLIVPWLLVTLPLAMMLARWLNLLRLGDEIAEGLGLPVERTRLLLLLLAVTLVAVVVAVAGPIGFVALPVPHLTRRLLQTSDARWVLPVSALIGASLVAIADVLARLVLHPNELPVGLWTVMIGAPLLIFLLRRSFRRGGEGITE